MAHITFLLCLFSVPFKKKVNISDWIFFVFLIGDMSAGQGRVNQLGGIFINGMLNNAFKLQTEQSV